MPGCFSIRSKNEGACDKILLELRRYLRSLPFSFGNVSIISGEEEGLYGWITANYLMGNFVEVSVAIHFYWPIEKSFFVQ